MPHFILWAKILFCNYRLRGHLCFRANDKARTVEKVSFVSFSPWYFDPCLIKKISLRSVFSDILFIDAMVEGHNDLRSVHFSPPIQKNLTMPQATKGFSKILARQTGSFSFSACWPTGLGWKFSHGLHHWRRGSHNCSRSCQEMASSWLRGLPFSLVFPD